MENKNNSAMYSVIFLVVGIFVGWLIWGSGGMGGNTMMKSGMHQMSNGMMMDDDDMGMNAMMTNMSASLEGKTGDAFDKAFIDGMIIHHQGAIDMANMVLATSKRPELIKLANDIIAAQTAEIDMMKAWREAWF